VIVNVVILQKIKFVESCT